MKKLWIIALLFSPLVSISQRLHLNLFGGFSNYMGDIQDKPVTFDQSNGALGAGLQYDLTNHFSLRSGLQYGRVGAQDKFNRPSLQPRNLSFESKIIEGNLLLEYSLLDITVKKITPYVFGGIAIYHFDPYAYDTLGYKVFLKPLSTEGQGLDQYPDKKPYQLTQFAIPLGIGVKFRMTENVVVGYEIGMRKLFTDYLDDLSTTYVDASLLALAKGPKAVEMAYRGGELKNGAAYPGAAATRGGAKQMDWYYFQGITLRIGLRTGNEAGWGRSRTGCPARVL